MATILESLKGVNGYPVPETAFITIATRRGLNLTDVISEDILKSQAYRLAKADVLMWVSQAPNVSQADVSFTLTDDARRELRNEANAIYDELGDVAFSGAKYGYKGSRL